MIDLNKYPIRWIHRVKSDKFLFVVRMEKDLPPLREGLCKEKLAISIAKASLNFLSTEQRVLGYTVLLSGRPRIQLGWNYLYAFYGIGLSSVKINYQDPKVRLVSGGNGNFLSFVIRSQDNKEEETDENE